MNVKVKKNFNLNNIKLDFSKELNNFIDLIAVDIEKGINKGSQFGQPFKRNAESTIRKKGFDHPLKHTGLMMNPNKMIKTKATSNHQAAKLTLNEDRIDIGFWNDQGTYTIPARPFFGISQNADKEIMIRTESKIERELRRA